MLLRLPALNAVLNPCSVDRAAFTAHPQGNFCGHCQRVVQDFSQSPDPVADLAAARAAAPDGRVCGSFRRAQVAPAPTLTRRLRWFLLALVLVVGQGLTAREAWAQVRRPVPQRAAGKKPMPGVKKPAQPLPPGILPREETIIDGEISALPDIKPLAPTGNEVYTEPEQMPELPGGGGNAAIVAYIQQRVRQPRELKTALEGRVFVGFVVGQDGVVREAQIVKGMGPPLDAEALRAVRALPAFTPGRQSGRAVAVRFTVPVKFEAK